MNDCLLESTLATSPLTNGLMLIHGNQPEALCDLLVAWMRRYPLAPLENEIILVQSNGIAQWLKLALAADNDARPGAGCGIAAALEMSLPARFLWQAYRAVLGRDQVPDTSPFDKSLLVWRLMRLLPKMIRHAPFAPLRRFLENDEDLRKRFQLAERLADLYDQYQVYRADWLAAWAAQQDVLILARGERQPLPEEQCWQAELWRAVRDDVRATESPAAIDHGRAAVHQAFLQRATLWPADQRPAGLPRRIMVFGISSLPSQSLEVLATLAQWSQVLMCVHNPCEHYWADIVADQDLLRAAQKRQRRRAGMPAELSAADLHLHAHPLLAAWGKQGRDFIGLLDAHDSQAARAGYRQHFADLQQRMEVFLPHGDACLLNQLQEDIRDLRPLGETRQHWPAVDPADASLRFHITHSPQREVEVLHDRLLAAFNADATLRPRDVIVMVPDINTYVPHIQAVFGLLDSAEPRHIPFSIVDQGKRQHDPLIKAVETLLGLPLSRIAVSDVLDLMEVPALRQRFGIRAADLPVLQRWIRGANIRWGLHAQHRERLGLPAGLAENTWLFGMRRMLLGYAVGNADAAWQGIEPYDEIGGLDAALLGPLTRLLDALDAAWSELQGTATVADWCTRLRGLMAKFFMSNGNDDSADSDDAFTLLQFELALQRWREAAGATHFAGELPLSVASESWLAQLDEGGLSQRFFAGAVTFATLMPMRAIPFRQVCLLGMNDGDYPRARAPMDFDLMGKDYRPGDRSRREDDRYLFLEAVLSAREHLHISWVGRSINDNTLRPPSVLVGQLRDHLRAGWRLEGHADPGQALLDALTVEHRLQPFSPDYFPAKPESSRLYTYAAEWQAAGITKPFSSGVPLAELPREEPLSCEDLAGFLRDPVKTFFVQRLRVSFAVEDPSSEDQEAFALTGLEKWTLQDTLIAAQAVALQRGNPREAALTQALEHMQRRGELAAKAFGDLMVDELAAPMEDLFARYQAGLARWPHSVAADEEVNYCRDTEPAGAELMDWLGGLRLDADGQRGRVVLETSDVVKDGNYQCDKLIKHWVAHLAAHCGGGPLTTLVVSKVGQVELKPLTHATAQQHLDALLSAWQAGQRRPLPLAVKTAFAWLSQWPPTDDGKAATGARLRYEGDAFTAGEISNNAYLRRAYPDFAALHASGEFARLAESLLQPLYQAVFAHASPQAAGVPKSRHA